MICESARRFPEFRVSLQTGKKSHKKLRVWEIFSYVRPGDREKQQEYRNEGEYRYT